MSDGDGDAKTLHYRQREALGKREVGREEKRMVVRRVKGTKAVDDGIWFILRCGSGSCKK